MYTELHYNVELKSDVPAEVLAALRTMLYDTLDAEGNPCHESKPDHPLFKTDRWQVMLRMDSYYFSADTHSTLRFDKIANQWFLCIRCNLKNYTGEIEAFIDWIDPYVDAFRGNFLGFYRYEETEEPTLIYKR